MSKDHFDEELFRVKKRELLKEESLDVIERFIEYEKDPESLPGWPEMPWFNCIACSSDTIPMWRVDIDIESSAYVHRVMKDKDTRIHCHRVTPINDAGAIAVRRALLIFEYAKGRRGARKRKYLFKFCTTCNGTNRDPKNRKRRCPNPVCRDGKTLLETECTCPCHDGGMCGFIPCCEFSGVTREQMEEWK